MLAQVITNVLYVVIAAGMLFQIVTVVRHAARIARKRRALHAQVRPIVRPKAPVQPIYRRTRRRDYRLALRAARVSVAA